MEKCVDSRGDENDDWKPRLEAPALGRPRVGRGRRTTPSTPSSPPRTSRDGRRRVAGTCGARCVHRPARLARARAERPRYPDDRNDPLSFVWLDVSATSSAARDFARGFGLGDFFGQTGDGAATKKTRVAALAVKTASAEISRTERFGSKGARDRTGCEFRGRHPERPTCSSSRASEEFEPARRAAPGRGDRGGGNGGRRRRTAARRGSLADVDDEAGEEIALDLEAVPARGSGRGGSHGE